MDNDDLRALQDLKQKLVEKANRLILKLKEQEQNQRSVTLELPDTTYNNINKQEKLMEENELQILEVSRRITGITFEDTDRKWLRNNIYMYKTCLVSKDLKLFVELTVKQEGDIKYEIQNITCNFVDIAKCYMLEIQPWVQRITKTKNFSYLTSSISQYSEGCITRKKIIAHLESSKYINYDECEDANGGIVIYLHPPQNTELIYLTIHWSLMFSEQTWQIEHSFEMKATEAGLKFEEDNRELIEEFSKPGITKDTVIALWTDLCSSLDL